MDNIKIGKTIKELRLNKGLSQSEVANICNITAPAVSKWERGESIPDISSLESLSNLFGVSINEIINSKAVINVTSSKNIIWYRWIVTVLAIALLLLSGLWIRYYYNVQTTLRLLDDQLQEMQEKDSNDTILSTFLMQKEQPYHLYYEATEHQQIQGDINRWIYDIFIQEPDLYDYFTGTSHPSLNDLSVDTTDLVRRDNQTSTIRITWHKDNHDLHWTINVTYYDIENDEDYQRLNAMNHVTSNGNQYDFDVFDNGYFVLYELLQGNSIYDNYYFHISDLKPTLIDTNIRIDYELHKLGIDIIFTDNFEITRYHFTLNEYDASHQSWFLQYHLDAYLQFQDGNNKLILKNYVMDGEKENLLLEAYQDDMLIWDNEFLIMDYLEREIDIDESDYIIRYQKQYTGLLYIEFESKLDGHIMSYFLLPNELTQ